MFDLCSSDAREHQVCKPHSHFSTVQDRGLIESLRKVRARPDAGARLDFSRRRDWTPLLHPVGHGHQHDGIGKSFAAATPSSNTVGGLVYRVLTGDYSAVTLAP